MTQILAFILSPHEHVTSDKDGMFGEKAIVRLSQHTWSIHTILHPNLPSTGNIGLSPLAAMPSISNVAAITNISGKVDTFLMFSDIGAYKEAEYKC